jgi:hypothetical protein
VEDGKADRQNTMGAGVSAAGGNVAGKKSPMLQLSEHGGKIRNYYI